MKTEQITSTDILLLRAEAYLSGITRLLLARNNTQALAQYLEMVQEFTIDLEEIVENEQDAQVSQGDYRILAEDQTDQGRDRLLL